jgi:hypothetical protein
MRRNWSKARAPGVAIIAHPHPLFGGTMDNKVVQTLARAFVQCGYTVVRFNFRGVGASAGEYDAGKAELQDLLAVVQQVAPEGPSLWPAFPSAPSSPAMRWPNSGVQAGAEGRAGRHGRQPLRSGSRACRGP